MSRAKTMIVAGGVALLLVGGGVGGWSAWRAAQVRAAVAASAPARPDLPAGQERLRAHVAELETRVQQGELAALIELGGLYHANGFYDEARAIYEALRGLQPREARWPHRLGAIDAIFGELEPAVALAREAVALAPDYVPARVRLGDALEKAGRLDEAAEVFRAILTLDPEQSHAHHGLARIDAARGRWADVRARLEPRVERSAQGQGSDLLTTAYEALGDTARAGASRARWGTHGLFIPVPDPWIDEINLLGYDPFRLGLESGAAELRGDDEEALRLILRAVSLAPGEAHAHMQAGMLYEKRGRMADARRSYEQTVKADPRLSDGWLKLYRLLEKQGDAAGAARVLSEGLANVPDSGGLLYERGRRLKEAGQLARAEQDLRRAIALRHDDAGPAIELAAVYFAQDKIAEGKAALAQALVAEPDHPAALGVLTFTAIRERDRAEADRWWGRLLRQPRAGAREREQLRAAYRETFGVPPP